MTITLTYASLYDKVERSLSIIGKRSKDADGNPLFTDITLGSREKEIIYDYFRQAVIDLSAELSVFVSGGYTGIDTDTVSLDLPSNYNAALLPFLQKSCEAYCVSYALASWFNITAPNIAEKYAADYVRQMTAVRMLVNNKKAPTAGGHSYQDVTGTTSPVGSNPDPEPEPEPTPPNLDFHLGGEPVEFNAPGEMLTLRYTPAVGAEDDVTVTSSDTSVAAVEKLGNTIIIKATTFRASTCTITVKSISFGLTETITVLVNGGEPAPTPEQDPEPEPELDAPKHSVLPNYVAIRDTSDSEEKYYLVDVSSQGNPALVYTERPSDGDSEDGWQLPKVTKESTSWCKVKKDNTALLFELNSTVYYYRDGEDVEDLAYALLETDNIDSTYLESAGSGEYTEYSIPIVEIQDVLSEFSKDYDLDNYSFYLPVEDIIKYREYYDIEVSVYGQAQSPDIKIYDNTKSNVLDTLYTGKALPYTLTSEDIQRIVTAEAQYPSEIYLGLSDNYQEGDTATLTFTRKS